MRKRILTTTAITFISMFMLFFTSYAETNTTKANNTTPETNITKANTTETNTVKTNTTVANKSSQEERHSIGYNLGRGAVNILLCWFEIPRQIVHQSSMVPVFGIVSGAIYGVAVTGWRALSGVTDLLSLGFGGGDIYFAQGLPEFPWQGYWVRHGKDNEN